MTWKNLNDGKQFHLRPGDNYIHKFLGFCTKCNCALTQIGYIEEVDFIFWKEVFCKVCEPEKYKSLFKEH